jgi:hypothetical protein
MTRDSLRGRLEREPSFSIRPKPHPDGETMLTRGQIALSEVLWLSCMGTPARPGHQETAFDLKGHR